MSKMGVLSATLDNVVVSYSKAGRPQDPCWGWVKALIPGTNWKEVVSNTDLTRTGNPTIETTIKPFPKSGSIHVTSGNWFKMALARIAPFGAGAFTIDMWVYFPVKPINKRVFDNQKPTSGTNYPYMAITSNSNGALTFGVIDVAPYYGWNSTVGNSWTAAGWHHLAVVRGDDNTAYGFADGVLKSWSQYLTASNLANMVDDLVFGHNIQIGNYYDIDMYISDIRFTDGIARWTTPRNYSIGTKYFDPPAYAAPQSGPPIHHGVFPTQALAALGLSALGTHVSYSLKNVSISATGTVPPKKDNLFNYVSFLNHGETLTNLVDGSAASIVNVGGAVPDVNLTSIDPYAKKFGWGSIKTMYYYDTSNNKYVGYPQWGPSAAWNLGTAQFTIELSVFFAQDPSTLTGMELLYIGTSSGYRSLKLYLNQGYLDFDMTDNTGYTRTTYSSGDKLQAGRWYDIALVRGFDPNQNQPYGTNDVYMYCDGVLIGSTWRCEADLSGLDVDGFLRLQGSRYGYVFIDEIRVTKGIARYPWIQNENYDPLYYDVPTQPFPDTGPTPHNAGGEITLDPIEYTAEGHGVVVGEASPALGDITVEGVAGALAAFGGDPDWNKVSLLMHGESWKDEVTGVDATVVGNNQISNAVAKFGEGSLRVHRRPDDSTAGSVTFTNDLDRFNFGVGPFTVEFWYWPVPESKGSIYNAALIAQYGIVTHPQKFWAVNQEGGKVYFQWVDQALFGSTSKDSGRSGNLNKNTWNHICVERDAGGNLRVYLDGVIQAKTQSYTHDISGNANPLIIGSLEPEITTLGASGFFDEIRITKGFARYGSDSGFPLQKLPFDSVPHQDNQGTLVSMLDSFGLDFSGTLPEAHLCTLAGTLGGIGIDSRGVKQLASWTRSKGCALLIGA